MTRKKKAKRCKSNLCPQHLAVVDPLAFLAVISNCELPGLDLIMLCTHLSKLEEWQLIPSISFIPMVTFSSLLFVPWQDPTPSCMNILFFMLDSLCKLFYFIINSYWLSLTWISQLFMIATWFPFIPLLDGDEPGYLSLLDRLFRCSCTCFYMFVCGDL